MCLAEAFGLRLGDHWEPLMRSDTSDMGLRTVILALVEKVPSRQGHQLGAVQGMPRGYI